MRIGKKCINNCSFCSETSFKYGYDKDFSNIVDEIDSLKKSGKKKLILSCNADCRSDVIKILKYAKNV